MLHIRVVTTPGLIGRLLDRLADLPGIRNLIVLQGAVQPAPAPSSGSSFP